jgi:type IV pilus biogenesis protein CpaD/CtpE
VAVEAPGVADEAAVQGNRHPRSLCDLLNMLASRAPAAEVAEVAVERTYILAAIRVDFPARTTGPMSCGRRPGDVLNRESMMRSLGCQRRRRAKA